MKNLIAISSAILFGNMGAWGQVEPLPVGTIVPERITFTIGEEDESFDRFGDGDGDLLKNLEPSNLRSYEGQVILLMYHASW